MIRNSLLVALAAALASPAFGQATPVPPAAAPAPQSDLVPVAIDTSLGRIVIALDRGRAPASTANFLHYVDSGKYNGETIYRAIPYGDGGLIQGGVRSDARKLAKPVAHEPTSQTGLKHEAGAVSMANAGPGTARADFFILTADIPALDATAADPGFAVFGKVVEGMDVAKAILASPVSPDKGEGPMKGQILEQPVKIVKAARVK